ncbi:MAG: flavodoxin [Bacteroidaceae bacterium]|nr:flavodoxin [Bacteroidaceae bacterium]
MNKCLMLLAAMWMMTLSIGAQNAKQTKVNQKNKTIVVYFSHAGENYSVGHVKVGNTKIVADYISELTGADQFEIVAQKSYDMPYAKLIEVAKEEARKGEKPALKEEWKKGDQYDTVFVGGPIWWGTFPQVMFTFFDKYNLNDKTIIPFTTHEGSGLGNAVSDLKEIYPKATFRTSFAIYGHEVRGQKAKVEKWLRGLGYSIPKK